MANFFLEKCFHLTVVFAARYKIIIKNITPLKENQVSFNKEGSKFINGLYNYILLTRASCMKTRIRLFDIKYIVIQTFTKINELKKQVLEILENNIREEAPDGPNHHGHTR